jgi:hypothetical protein
MNQTTSRPTLEHSNLELNIDSKLVKITKRICLETKCVFFLTERPKQDTELVHGE